MMNKLFLAGMLSLYGLSCNGPNESDTDNIGTAWGPGAFSSNGERIYFTATSDRETPIEASTFEAEGMMMLSGRIACASCHGPDATGGSHRMEHHTMITPDIRWKSLAGEHEHGDEEDTVSDEHNDVDYDLSTFRMAVVEGKHPDGTSLSREMPRWKISDDDLSNIAEFLRSFE